MEGSFWKRCNTCKGEIGYASGYYVCSVSTCHRKGTDFAFCTVECWEAHVPLFRHRDAWAEERRAPGPGEAARIQAGRSTSAGGSGAPVSSPEPASAKAPSSKPPSSDELPPLDLNDRSQIPEDILVVASKLKSYIRERSGMNTSDGVLPALSHILRNLCDDAIERAHADGRKTVMDRDLP